MAAVSVWQGKGGSIFPQGGCYYYLLNISKNCVLFHITTRLSLVCFFTHKSQGICLLRACCKCTEKAALMLQLQKRDIFPLRSLTKRASIFNTKDGFSLSSFFLGSKLFSGPFSSCEKISCATFLAYFTCRRIPKTCLYSFWVFLIWVKMHPFYTFSWLLVLVTQLQQLMVLVINCESVGDGGYFCRSVQGCYFCQRNLIFSQL